MNMVQVVHMLGYADDERYIRKVTDGGISFDSEGIQINQLEFYVLAAYKCSVNKAAVRPYFADFCNALNDFVRRSCYSRNAEATDVELSFLKFISACTEINPYIFFTELEFENTFQVSYRQAMLVFHSDNLYLISGGFLERLIDLDNQKRDS